MGKALQAHGAPRLALRPGEAAGQWRAEVEERLCSGWPGSQFLFGGFAFGGCIDALLRETGLPVHAAACHFVSMARPGDVLDYSVEGEGAASLRQFALTARCGGRTVARVLAVAGSRSGEDLALPDSAPAPAPEDCQPFSLARLMSSNVHGLFEARLVEGQLPDSSDWTCAPVNHCRFWARRRDGIAADRITLAAIGDFLAIGIPGAAGAVASGTSLDNHMRFVREAEADWVLCSVTIEAVASGLVHGRIAMHDRQARLLAVGSQTMVFRSGR